MERTYSELAGKANLIQPPQHPDKKGTCLDSKQVRYGEPMDRRGHEVYL